MQDVKQILDRAGILAEYNREYNSWVGNAEFEARKSLTYLYMEACKLVQEHEWPVLVREHTVTLVEGQEVYPLPGDYDRQLQGTHYNRSDQRRVFEAVQPSDWQQLKASNTTNVNFQRMRVFGWLDSQINFYTAPAATDAGQTIVFEYVSNAWNTPRRWASGLAVQANDFVWHNGNRYSVGSNGSLGGAAPTHTSGTVDDLTYVADYGHDNVVADTDIPLLDDQLLTLGVTIRALRQDSLNRDSFIQEYARRLEQVKTNLSSAPTIRMFNNQRPFPFATPTLPEVWG